MTIRPPAADGFVDGFYMGSEKGSLRALYIRGCIRRFGVQDLADHEREEGSFAQKMQ